ncbi:MAG: hypothetical protein QOG04_2372 [Actinomycetota bacterium]|jgi:hypothetical protein|nr:hypothetical protein [Actinomycetota bacterium]
MDLSRLSTAHKIGIGGALVLLIDSFLPWYSVSFLTQSISINGWDAEFLAWGGIVAGVAAGVVLALKAMGQKDLGSGSMTAEQIAFILGVVSFVLIALRFLTETSDAAFGLFLGIIASGAVAYGAFMAKKESPSTPNTMGSPPPPTM